MDFKVNVYKVVAKIPKGKVATYGFVAAKLGNPRLARQVGWALHANRSVDVPCHRVVDRDGRLAPNFGGPSLRSFGRRGLSKSSLTRRSGAFDGWREQRKRLLVEGIEFCDEMHVDLEKFLWQA